MTFQEKLVVIRKIMGCTQDDVASVAGVSRQAVYKWESGQSYPEVTTLVKVRDFYRESGSGFGFGEITIDNLLDDNFIVEKPAKRKRRKRMEKDVQRQIEEIVEAEERGEAPGKTLEQLLAELTASTTKAQAPKKEETASPKAEVEEPKAEPAAVVVEEEAVAEEAEIVAEPEKKKKGLFGLFGRK